MHMDPKQPLRMRTVSQFWQRLHRARGSAERISMWAQRVEYCKTLKLSMLRECTMTMKSSARRS
jgi:hypothetical protein